MRVLIVGCGDLGLRVARLLLADARNEVWGIRRHPPCQRENWGMRWVKADLTQPMSPQILPADMTHLVFTVAPDARDESTYRAVYRRGIENVVNAINTPSLRRVVFVSSSAVYGDHGDDWVDEDTPPNPPAFNGQVLLETERWLQDQAAATDGRLRATSLRLSGIYGPGRTHLLQRLRAGQASAPASSGHWANRVHVDDAARAVVHVLDLPAPAAVYVVTDDTPLQMRTLYESLAQLVGGPRPAAGPPPAGMGNKRLSNVRLRATGFDFEWKDARPGHAALLRGNQS